MYDKHVLLLILDGFGIGKPNESNAIALAGTPNINKLMAEYPHTTMDSSGLAVGLPKGQMGNSEVGHLNLGAGKVVYQKLTIINQAVEKGDLYKNKTLLDTIDNSKGRKLHLAGLCSDGGVHSELEHLYEVIRVAKSRGVCEIFIHAFLDGRDTPPKSAIDYITQLEEKFREIGCGKIATIGGRYFGMDRDKRWDRVLIAYDCLTLGQGFKSNSGREAILDAYYRGETDEFIKPTAVIENGKPIATIEDGDSFIHFNFRPDRARELTQSLTDQDFSSFERKKFPKINYTCFCKYDESFGLPIIFPEEMLNQDITTTLGKVVSDAGMKQLRIAETEKYAHVTYFLNGGREDVYQGEDRILVQSPQVPTYDLQPEMAAPEVTDKLIDDIKIRHHNFIVCNFANCDMVGHTGVVEATIKAVQIIDSLTGKVTQAANENGYDVLICADHGNAEEMIDKQTRLPQTAHSTNPVPLIFVPKPGRGKFCLPEGGILCDVTGFIIYLLGLEPPKEMKSSIYVPKVFD